MKFIILILCSLISVSVAGQDNVPARSPYIDMATDQIRSALRAGDIAKAERLATTAEQLEMVNEAKRDSTRTKIEAARERRSRVVVCQHLGNTSVCR